MVVLKPSENLSDTSDSLRSFDIGPLSSLTGPNLSSGTKFGLSILESRDFFEKYFTNEEFMELFFNTYHDGGSSLFETAYKKFHSSNLEISVDDETSYLRLTLYHYNPDVLKDWLNVIVYDLNATMAEIDRLNAEKYINFLQFELEKTKISELRKNISELIKVQVQKYMYASESEGYIFSILDSPRTPDIKSQPSRSLIVIIFFILSLLLSSSIIIFLNIYNKEILFSVLPPSIRVKDLNINS